VNNVIERLESLKKLIIEFKELSTKSGDDVEEKKRELLAVIVYELSNIVDEISTW